MNKWTYQLKIVYKILGYHIELLNRKKPMKYKWSFLYQPRIYITWQ